MKAVILAGGFGTRIRDVAENIPKPMIPIGPHPILWHIMTWYSHFGVNEFVICLGYKGNQIRDFFLNYRNSMQDFTIDLSSNAVTFHGDKVHTDWKITLAETGANAMTGARIKSIKKHIPEGETFMITYGDGLGDVDIANLLAFHKSHGKTMTVTGVRPPGRFGEIAIGEENIVTGFNEKPQTAGGRISGGFFVANYNLFDYLNDDQGLVFEKEPMENMVSDQELMTFKHDGFWQPMDTAREYALLNSLYESGEAPWIR